MCNQQTLYFLLVIAILLPCFSQSTHTYVVEQIPFYSIIDATKANGSYYLGNDMWIESKVIALGNCKSGVPCAANSGTPRLKPPGCPSECDRGFPGDFQYEEHCVDKVGAFSPEYLREMYDTLTPLVTNWVDVFGSDCLLSYNEITDEWQHELEGVAIVTRSKGFSFPPQSLLTSDVDSSDVSSGIFPFVQQEVLTIFGYNKGTLVRPNLSFASAHHSPVELLANRQLVEAINVTLTEELLTELEIDAGDTWVWGAAAGLSRETVGRTEDWIYPEFASDVLGGVVWSEMGSSFDTLVQSMTLANRIFESVDQGVQLYPVAVRKRCRCVSRIEAGMIMRVTEDGNICEGSVVENESWSCDESGEDYCNFVQVTGWHRIGRRSDGRFDCEQLQVQRVVWEIKVATLQQQNGR